MGINRKNEIDFRYGPLVGIKSDGSRVVILSEEMLGEDLQIDEKGKLTLNAPKAVEKLSLVNRFPGDITDNAGGLAELFAEYKLVEPSADYISSIFTLSEPLDIGVKVYDSVKLNNAVVDGSYWIYTDETKMVKVQLKVIDGLIVEIVGQEG